jgi:hypothetical protein
MTRRSARSSARASAAAVLRSDMIAPASSFRPREMRLITVPIATPTMSAISAY